jgi:LysM repeat protein
LKRLGLIVCVGVGMMPIAYTLRQGAGDVFQTAPTGGAAAVPVLSETVGSAITTTVPSATLLVAVAPADAAPTALADDLLQIPPTTEFDIDALPPATPVDAAETAAAASEAPATRAPATTQAPPTTQAPATKTAATTTPATASSAPRTRASAAPVCSKSYTVVGGDYWILIAQKVGVSIKELLAANGATATTALFPGRDICLPSNASTPTTAAPATAAATPSSQTKVAPTTTKPTTAKPTTTVAPTTTVPRRVYSAAEVEAIIREVWPDELEDEAVRIARRESNLQPTARNACCYGLFQIYWSVHKGWLAQMGITSAEQLFDPALAAKAGLALYQRSGGWGPWVI